MIPDAKIDFTFTAEPAGLYDPLRYMISIGGKRIRPRLCLLAWSLFRGSAGNGDAEPTAGVLAAARALEVFHSFTLMHDDIMDRSPLRRGMPTVWKKWNEDTAILSGDVMLIDAYRSIARCGSAAVLDVFTETAAQVCEGQQFDMEFESRDDVSMAEYEKMIGLKTAVLLACAARIGAMLAGADEPVCEALYRYGYELGMAFQVADDYLDAFGDEAVFGKPIGGDIINCKSSWLTVRALELAPDAEALLRTLRAPAETEAEKAAKIATVKGEYVALGVDKDATEAIAAYSKKAMDAVAGLGFDADKLAALDEFVNSLTGRVK